MSIPRFAAVAVAIAISLIGCDRGGAVRPNAESPRANAEAATAGTRAPTATSRVPAPVAPAAAFTATVDRVVDGDTVIASRPPLAQQLRVRLIGFDAPESAQPGAPTECFGAEAAAALTELLHGKQVRAAYQAGGRQDRFGRELWDVWTTDGGFVAGAMVDRGFARALRVRPQVAHAAYLTGLEADARAAGRGLWAACAQ